MPSYPFLSPEWIDAVAAIRDEYVDRVASPSMPVRANVTVTAAPFADPIVQGHVDTTAGALTLDRGHLEGADFTIEMPYDVAAQIFVDRDPAALVGILVGGKVKLSGDSSKVLGLAGLATPPAPGSETAGLAHDIIARIDAITESPSGS
ncbi:MAG: hypothetical protein R2695_01920 [Acidimicrobiales bacterium]